jgi:hypothetical protein
MIKPFNELSQPNVGFIAQEIETLIPNSTNKSTAYLPTINDYAYAVSGDIFRFSTKTVQDICMAVVPVNIELYNYEKVRFTRVVDKIIDNLTFSITEPLSESDISNRPILVYGQEFDDFRSLNYNAIFTVMTSALKELDTQYQESKKTIKEQQSQIQNLQKQIDTIMKRLSDANIA